MATTYTENYHLGKQENHADKFDMKVITDNMDKIDEALGHKPDDTDLLDHINDKDNPHDVTKAQLGLGNVENKSSATIRGELTAANVNTALGMDPIAAISALTDCGAKNLLPNPHTSDVKNGVTITVNPDGSVLMDGTATADVSLILPVTLQPGAYILTGCPAGGGSGTNYRMPLRKIDGNVYVGADYGSGFNFEVSEETAYNVLIYVPKNVVCDNLLFQPMIRRAELPAGYQHYAPTNRQLYEMILALQSGNQVQSVQSTAQLMASSEEETR